ncbi:hypothetical protein TIFTF001_003260 [Ficus carica]|uniref:Uncharacterized protein n=1 Tax=Ficus carica TaxID=3494 RepID=A0AA88CTV7_FICCA|nr:hypothetical protein TIFTF001_003260 [Ficus carica]
MLWQLMPSTQIRALAPLSRVAKHYRSRPCLTHALSTVHNLVLLPTSAHLLAGLASHSPLNRELAGLTSQPLSNRNKKLGARHRGERIFDDEGRPKGEQGGGGS